MALRVTRSAVEIAGKKAVAQVVAPGHLPELVDVFLHNWQASIEIENGWETDVTIARSGAEERRGLRDRPFRDLSVHFTGLVRSEAARVWQAAQRFTQQRLLVPVYPDYSVLQANATAGISTLFCDTTSRRFVPGSRAVIVGFTSGNRPAFVEFIQIDTVTDTQITTVDPLDIDHDQPARVYPVVIAELALETRARLITDEIADLRLDLHEVPGPTALPPWIPPWDDPAWPTYRQVPVLQLRPDWAESVSLMSRRAGDRRSQGRSVVVTTGADRPRWGCSFTLTGMDRTAAIAILRFLDSRQGRVRTFWMASPLTNWTAADLTPARVRVEPTGNLDDLRRFVENVALVYGDGSAIIREVIEITDSWEIVFREPIPASSAVASQLYGVTTAHRVRLASDSYREEWLTDDKIRIAVDVIEPLHERPVEIDRFDTPIRAETPDRFDDLFFWGAARPDTLFQNGGGAADITGDDVVRWVDMRSAIVRELITEVPPLEAPHEYFTGLPGPVRFANIGASGEKGEFYLSTDETWHSNAGGMTLFLLMQRRVSEGYDSGDDFLFRYPDAAFTGTDILEWTATGIRLYEDEGVEDQDFWITTNDILSDRGAAHVVVFTWKPGVYARVYRDGELMGESARAPIDLPTSPTRKARLLRMANDLDDASSTDDSWVESVVGYRRALSIGELNVVGQHLATQSSGITWGKIR